MIGNVSGFSSSLSTNVANKSLNTNKDNEIQNISKQENTKLQDIKDAIKDGTYKIDMKKTAGAILDTLV
ncbi:hypothetical protein BFG04_01610 [Campylobacter pinnipediorum subsp. pinnipediorum]|uniref:Anti-sigma-28 factor FlgM C-terminal domain-containing protein n=1 Tax=Campylobacter pinnipediorum subsp. pinnipediorum TaxID=1660067 RepID=A0AAX0LBI6_9BACT|nr:flagellar biosynthesis anti-sigma factor FlgM [Campylobacter pinnipediorum]AQW84662.1 anti-sigma factor FlgM [Campylobacter pinnipediorum subsp. pinnipediorum]OPA79531.1 hypothetical protein BFG05_00020 [Campylobacter pinnipediorum subsp. pinnipediorum]OPA81863.1 hypothetical protein BFG04_01610 [Campylobacter pinnipediorum subsp. pinnipediorum]